MIGPEEAAKVLVEWLNNLTINRVTKKERCLHCLGTGETEVVTITFELPKS